MRWQTNFYDSDSNEHLQQELVVTASEFQSGREDTLEER